MNLEELSNFGASLNAQSMSGYKEVSLNTEALSKLR